MNERIQVLREMMLNVSHSRYRERRALSILGKGYDDESLIIRKARAFELICTEMPIFLQENELIVGGRTMFMPQKEENDFWGDNGKRNLDFLPDAETLETKSPGFEFYPHYAKDGERALGQTYEIGEGYVTSHCVSGYGNVLQYGFGGLKQKAVEKLSNSKTLQKKESDFLNAVVICMEAATTLVKRYAQEAEARYGDEKDQKRKDELKKIANICSKISTEPAGSFYEALQLLYFTHILTLIENYNLMALGRMDQYLFPFFRQDILEGNLSFERAKELLECLFIKLNDTSDLHTDNGLNIMLSGLTPSGDDGTNELTYLIIDVHFSVGLTDPQINIRVHDNSPEKLFEYALFNGTTGAKPMIYNDNSVIAALENVGIETRHARDYCIDACQDILIAEKSDFYPIFAGIYGCHLLTVFERVVKKLPQCDTFEEFFSLLKKEISSDVQSFVYKANKTDSILPELSPTPFLSSTLDGCIRNAQDKTRGGTLYNHTGFIGGGIVNVADSMAAIKKIVFEEKRISPSLLIEALGSDFDNHEDIRLLLKNSAPKWGNNDEYVDSIAADLAHHFATEVLKYENPRGGRYLPGFFTHHQARLGKKIGATPDGRRQGEPLAVSLSPSNGAAQKRPTAIVLSASKIPHNQCPLGTSLDITFHPTIFQSTDEQHKFRAFVRTYFQNGGIEFQANSIDSTILKDAQQKPEEYRDLVVRVWGFNAYFTTLKKEYQDELIARMQ